MCKQVKDEFTNKIAEAAQRMLDATSICQPPVELPNSLPLLDPDTAAEIIGDEVYECEHTAYVFPALRSDPYDTTLRDYWPDDSTSCVAGTMALEGIKLSDNSIHNIERIKLGEDVYRIIDEIKAKYAAGDYINTLPQSEETK